MMNPNFFSRMIQRIVLVSLAFVLYCLPGAVQASGPDLVQFSSTGEEQGHAVVFSPEGQYLFAGTSRGIYCFQLSDLKVLRFTPTDTWVRALAISPDGSWLASGSYDPIVRVWRTIDGSQAQELTGHTGWVRGLAFSPKGDLLATASDDNTVRLWRMPDGASLGVFLHNEVGVRAVAFSPDGALLATGGFDRVIRLWRVSDGYLLHELKGHTDWVRALAFSPDGNWLASGAFDASLRVWRVSDGELVTTRKEHSSSVLGVAFSPDGALLASASVDTTVRLWRMPEVEPYALFKGHTDFVYAAAFAPDGRVLVSAGVDNALRVWHVPEEADPAALDATLSPSRCQACHHPVGSVSPARVIEVGCSTCHINGALSSNWCLVSVRARAPGGTTLQVTSAGSTNQLGTSRAAQDLSVVITSPGNGEHLYTQEDIRSTVKITGQVSSGTVSLPELDIYLEVWSQDQLVARLSTKAQENGYFSFLANIESNKNGVRPTDNSFKSRCSECHIETMTEIPAGEVMLIASVASPNGSLAFDQRLIYINHSENVMIPVQAALENGQPVPGVIVQAVGRLYEWRGRDFLAQSNETGKADLQVEALSLVPTTYQVSIPPMVVDGILYESITPVEVVLPPGVVSASPIHVSLRATLGRISGQLSLAPPEPLEMHAIHLPDGSVTSVFSLQQGTFEFSSLPVGRYQLVADPEHLAELGLTARSQLVDLSEQPDASITLPLSTQSGAWLSGKILQEDGRPVPFAFVSQAGAAAVHFTSPGTGSFSLPGWAGEAQTVLASAPGFYTQAAVVDPTSEQPFELFLTLRPETRLLEWGAGTVIAPVETAVVVNELDLRLERGWLWGSGKAEQPLTIRVEKTTISLPSGKFALEALPGQPGWFYLFEGQATIHRDGDPEIVRVDEGQMVILGEGSQLLPVPYDPLVIAALHPDGDLPFEATWEPSPGARARDRLSLAGINTAKAITLFTYILVILSIGGVPVVGLYWWLKHRNPR